MDHIAFVPLLLILIIGVSAISATLNSSSEKPLELATETIAAALPSDTIGTGTGSDTTVTETVTTSDTTVTGTGATSDTTVTGTVTTSDTTVTGTVTTSDTTGTGTVTTSDTTVTGTVTTSDTTVTETVSGSTTATASDTTVTETASGATATGTGSDTTTGYTDTTTTAFDSTTTSGHLNCVPSDCNGGGVCAIDYNHKIAACICDQSHIGKTCGYNSKVVIGVSTAAGAVLLIAVITTITCLAKKNKTHTSHHLRSQEELIYGGTEMSAETNYSYIPRVRI